MCCDPGWQLLQLFWHGRRDVPTACVCCVQLVDYLTLRIKVAWGVWWAESSPLTATPEEFFVALYLHFETL